jgi:hypothetical protein
MMLLIGRRHRCAPEQIGRYLEQEITEEKQAGAQAVDGIREIQVLVHGQRRKGSADLFGASRPGQDAPA